MVQIKSLPFGRPVISCKPLSMKSAETKINQPPKHLAMVFHSKKKLMLSDFLIKVSGAADRPGKEKRLLKDHMLVEGFTVLRISYFNDVRTGRQAVPVHCDVLHIVINNCFLCSHFLAGLVVQADDVVAFCI